MLSASHKLSAGGGSCLALMLLAAGRAAQWLLKAGVAAAAS